MKRIVVAALMILAGCRNPPTVWIAPHATADRPTFVIRDGQARHLDIVSCGDTTRPVWQADARANETLPSLVTDSTAALDGDCYLVRIVPGNERHFSVKSNRFLMQDVP